MTEVGWMVITSQGPMFWPLDEYAHALCFCEAHAEPVMLFAGTGDLDEHERANGEPGELLVIAQHNNEPCGDSKQS